MKRLRKLCSGALAVLVCAALVAQQLVLAEPAQAVTMSVNTASTTAEELWEVSSSLNDIVLTGTLAPENCIITSGDTVIKELGDVDASGSVSVTDDKSSKNTTLNYGLCNGPTWDVNARAEEYKENGYEESAAKEAADEDSIIPKLWLENSSSSLTTNATYTDLLTLDFPNIGFTTGNVEIGIRITIERLYIAKFTTGTYEKTTNGFLSFIGWTDADDDGTYETLNLMEESSIYNEEEREAHHCTNKKGEVTFVFTVTAYAADGTQATLTGASSGCTDECIDMTMLYRDIDMPGYTDENAFTWDPDLTEYMESIQFQDGWSSTAYARKGMVSSRNAAFPSDVSSTSWRLRHYTKNSNSGFAGIGAFTDETDAGGDTDTGYDNNPEQLRSAVLAVAQAQDDDELSASAKWSGSVCRTELGFGSTGTSTSVKLVKTGTDTDETLAGSTWELYECNESTGELADEPLTTLQTDDDGTLSLTGLAFGSYAFVETVAPSGYELLDEPVTFELTASQVAVFDTNGDGSVTEDDAITTDHGSWTQTVYQGLVTLTVYDEPIVSYINLTYSHSFEDEDDHDGLRPGNLKIYLLADGVRVGTAQTISSTTKWTCVWSSMPDKTTSGETIEYSIETFTVDYYETTIGSFADDGKGTGDLVAAGVSTYTPQKISLIVTKLWSGDDDATELRPGSVTVTLYANGESTGQTAVLSDDNGWSASFEELYKLAGGDAMEYSVVEDDVEHYTATYETTTSDDAIEIEVTNTLVDTPVLMPSTGAAALGLCALAGLACVGVALALRARRKRASCSLS